MLSISEETNDPRTKTATLGLNETRQFLGLLCSPNATAESMRDVVIEVMEQQLAQQGKLYSVQLCN